MEIRLRTTLAGPLLTAAAGEIIVIDRDLALALIKAGFAEPVVSALEKQPSPETAAVTVPEIAVDGPQRRRRK